VDLPTLAALSALATLLGAALHEWAGHGLACLCLGIPLKEVGAFYVSYAGAGVPEAQRRWVALAGPLASALAGLGAWALLRRVAENRFHLRYLLWLSGTLFLFVATGYPLFSALIGTGDLGTAPYGALHALSPGWLWRALTALLGFALYCRTAAGSARLLGGMLGAHDGRRSRARLLTWVPYATGGAVSVLVGLLNPRGLSVVLASAAASSLGAASGLTWLARKLPPPQASSAGASLSLPRRWDWILGCLLGTGAYALLLGRTVRL
jgi:hypothetical protein